MKRKSIVFLVMLGFVCLTTIGATPKKANASVILGLAVGETSVLGVGVVVTLYGAYKTHIGDWGACGTENHITSRDILNLDTMEFETYTYPECTKAKFLSIDLSQVKVVRLAKSDIPISATEGVWKMRTNDFSKGMKSEKNGQSYIR